MIMDKIIRKTNRYATISDAVGKLRSGPNWEEFTMDGLKAYMALILYME